MKLLKLIVRLLLGVVFTFSGFVKAVDPLGSEYKFTDYFTDAFGVPSLSAMSLGLAFFLSAIEFTVGIALLINIKPRLSSLGALLFMLVFTPLTLYSAIANPVTDCGCFGDALVISNWATFYKNLVFLAMAVFLFVSNKGNNTTYNANVEWGIAVIVFALCIVFQYNTLRHLPIIDFRPYKIGVDIPSQMIIPEGEKADSFAIFYTLKHQTTGETKKVDDNSYIKQELWKDSLWQITETSEPELVKSGYKPPIYNFGAYPVSLDETVAVASDDMMPDILANKNYSFMIVAYDLKLASMKGFDKIANLMNYAYEHKIKANLLTATSDDLFNYKSRIKFPVHFYNSDPITLKTVVRANPGVLLLKEGKIIGKWHYNDIPTIEEFKEMVAIKN